MKTRNAFISRMIGLTAVLFVVYLLMESRFVSSGIPSALNSDTPMLTAGRLQGIRLADRSYDEDANSHSFKIEVHTHATISSGTIGQLLAAYRLEVERIIEHNGAGIHERGIDGTTTNVQDFSFKYTWGRTHGIVRVDSSTASNGETQVVTLCYEH